MWVLRNKARASESEEQQGLLTAQHFSSHQDIFVLVFAEDCSILLFTLDVGNLSLLTLSFQLEIHHLSLPFPNSNLCLDFAIFFIINSINLWPLLFPSDCLEFFQLRYILD